MGELFTVYYFFKWTHWWGQHHIPNIGFLDFIIHQCSLRVTRFQNLTFLFCLEGGYVTVVLGERK